MGVIWEYFSWSFPVVVLVVAAVVVVVVIIAVVVFLSLPILYKMILGDFKFTVKIVCPYNI